MKVEVIHEDHWVQTPNGQLFARCWYPNIGVSAHHTAPIILFHDSLGSVELWRDFPTRLAEATNRVVVAYDRLGFGRSDPHPHDLSDEFIREEAGRYFPFLCASLNISDFIAFGHSVGGAMATQCAASFPDHCLALVIESAQAFVEERTLLGIRDAQEQFKKPGAIERLQKYHGQKAHWVLNAWTQTWLAPSYAGWTIEQSHPVVRCPLLVIHGKEDEFGSLSHPRRFAKLGQNEVALLILRDCRHVPHREKPQSVLDAVKRLIAPLDD